MRIFWAQIQIHMLPLTMKATDDNESTNAISIPVSKLVSYPCVCIGMEMNVYATVEVKQQFCT